MRTLSKALALLCVAAPAWATTLLYRDVPALAQSSDAIVRGKVLSAQSRWSKDRRRILTEVTVQVEETLKGQPGQTVVITQPGGVVGDIGQKVSGLASFTKGEEVFVFLEARGATRFIVNGMAQGKFRVDRTLDPRAPTAIPDPNAKEARILHPETRQVVELERAPVVLETLKARVREALAAQAPSQPPPPVQKAPGAVTR